VTGQVTFGDLLDAARRHLDQAGDVPGRPVGDRDLLDVTRGMCAVVTVMGRYLQDVTSGDGSVRQGRERRCRRGPARAGKRAVQRRTRPGACSSRRTDGDRAHRRPASGDGT
jgi:hypothetical protein